MKVICLLAFLFTSFVSLSQEALSDTLRLTIAPNVNQHDSLNQQIIATLKLFLNSKDISYTRNEYWLKADFEKYTYPYIDLQGIETGRLGKHYYQPSVMDIVETDKADRKIVKIAFIGYNEETKSSILKAIYNVVATKRDGKIIFSTYMDYITKDWKQYKANTVQYKISPSRTINFSDVARQYKAEALLCKFLSTKPVPITFYSCRSPKELFEILGFDYHPGMYLDTSGGWSRDKNVVLSANQSEYYLHEVAHVYIRHLFPSLNAFFNEGFATYIGGSGKHDYKWQKDKLLKFLIANPSFIFGEYIGKPYERLYYEKETPVPYVIGALVCERILRLYGKEKLFEMFRSNGDVFDILKTVGLTRENMNDKLIQDAKRPFTSSWH